VDAAASFSDFLAQLQARDDTATTGFVGLYRPIILRLARRRLRQYHLSRLLDPEDIAQEVFAKFYQRVLGKRDLAGPQELHRLLPTMAINLIRDAVRGAGRLRRGSARPTKEESHLQLIASAEHEPSYDLEIEEEIEEIHKLMSEEEWSLAWARASGKSWRQLAKQFGQSANTLRMRHSRALAHVRDEMNP
jgi:RNA polymerase sigma factor (sigma-70 family)